MFKKVKNLLIRPSQYEYKNGSTFLGIEKLYYNLVTNRLNHIVLFINLFFNFI